MEYGSRKVKWYALLLFMGFCGLAIYRLLQANPYLYAHSELRGAALQNVDRVRQTIPARPRQPSRLAPITFQPRYGLERNGIDPLGVPRSRAYVEAAFHEIKFDIPQFEPSVMTGDQSGFVISSKSAWVVAVNLNGQVRWRYKFANRAADTAPYVLLDEDYVYLVHPAGEILSLSKSDGELHWLLDLRQEVAAQPFFWNRHIVVPLRAADGRGEKLRMMQIRRADGLTELDPPRLAAKPGILFSFNTTLGALIGVVDNRVVAVDPGDWEILWSQTVTDPIRGSATLNDNQIYVSTLGAKIVKLDGAHKGRIEWEADLPKSPLAPPAYLPLAQKLSVLDQSGGLNTVDAKTGRAQWRQTTENRAALNETWSARLKARNIEEFRMDWSQKGWSIWSPCAERSLCIFTPSKGQLIQKIALSGAPLALPLVEGRGYAVLTQIKTGRYGLSRLVEESELKKFKESE